MSIKGLKLKNILVIEDSTYTFRHFPIITKENIKQMMDHAVESITPPAFEMLEPQNLMVYEEFNPRDFFGILSRGYYKASSYKIKKRKTESERNREFQNTVNIINKEGRGEKLNFHERNILKMYLKKQKQSDGQI
jgi:hypothetical protein